MSSLGEHTARTPFHCLAPGIFVPLEGLGFTSRAQKAESSRNSRYVSNPRENRWPPGGRKASQKLSLMHLKVPEAARPPVKPCGFTMEACCSGEISRGLSVPWDSPLSPPLLRWLVSHICQPSSLISEKRFLKVT